MLDNLKKVSREKFSPLYFNSYKSCIEELIKVSIIGFIMLINHLCQVPLFVFECIKKSLININFIMYYSFLLYILKIFIISFGVYKIFWFVSMPIDISFANFGRITHN